MNFENEYLPLNIFEFENFPQTKENLISGLNEKIDYFRKENSNKNLQNFMDKILLGVNWLNSLPDDSIPQLNDLEYYRLGVTSTNIFSVQIWQRFNKKEKISVKKEIIKTSE